VQEGQIIMTDTPDVVDKASLLEAIHRHRAELEATILPLSDDQLSAAPAGSWTICDVLAHLTAWEQSMVALLQGRPRHEGLGVNKATYDRHDVDAINLEIYNSTHDRSVDEVMNSFRTSHLQLLDVLDGLTDEDLQQPYSHYLPDEPGEESGDPIIGWVEGNTWHHYAEHLPTIRELVRS
jgi:hypothetical protein